MFQNASGGSGDIGVDKLLCKTVDTAYWKYIYSPELSDITTNTTIMSLQSMCRHHGIQDYYIAGWQKFNFWNEVNTNRIYCKGQTSCKDLIDKESNTLPAYAFGKHPNQLGHQIIADTLYRWIADCAQ
jgi:hypothetical protein